MDTAYDRFSSDIVGSENDSYDDCLDEFQQSVAVFTNNSFFLHPMESGGYLSPLKMWALPKPLPKRKNKYRKTEFARKRKQQKTDLINYPSASIPRIVKSDIRRQYAFMFANVYNQCDYDFMMEFIRIFYHANSSIRSRRSGQLLEHFASTKCKDASDFWFARMNDAADVTFSVSDTKYFLRSDATSRVEAKFRLSGTKLLPIRRQQLSSGNEVNSSIVLQEFNKSMSIYRQHMTAYGGVDCAMVQVQYYFCGETAIDIDSECHITSLDLFTYWNPVPGENIHFSVDQLHEELARF